MLLTERSEAGAHVLAGRPGYLSADPLTGGVDADVEPGLPPLTVLVETDRPLSVGPLAGGHVSCPRRQ